MQPRLFERVAYGRSIRERAEWLCEAHGPEAGLRAAEAAAEPGSTAQDRHFWLAVAERVARLSAPARGPLPVHDRSRSLR